MPHRSDRCQTRGSSARDCSSGPRDWVAVKILGRESMATRSTQEKEKILFPRRGEIYPIQKTRPAVVIQNDVSNQYSPITSMAAISSQFSDPPFPPKSSSSLERAACQDIRQ